MTESTLPGALVKNTEDDVMDTLGADVSVPPPDRSRSLGMMLLRFALVFVFVIVLWEGLKFIGGTPWRFSTNDGALFNFTWFPPFPMKFASDLNMPHLWDIFGAFIQPAQRNGPPLIQVLAQAAVVTMQAALAGFVIGTLLGLLLGTIFAHSPLLERALVPYVVASQTIPILAIAPMVVVWLKAGWWSVALLAAYLCFFPVTINTLRGLRSPDPRAIELMKSYAASRWTTLWKVRYPSALPYIFTALKIAATTAIVGAIIGELPSGLGEGLGRVILNFNSEYAIRPHKLWATILFTALVGILFFVTVILVERVMTRNMRKLES
ncbi:MAG: ABC transporter permease [Chloroflexota bacterium]|nr:MAG: ABC transporter permease [Chloroflexota bacterium]